ncbi:Flp pilus assembly protein TadB [Alkalibacillus almallahensis]|nr:Flp pilus assembly protein TadB [Alkalibacillus almallahensis]
MKKDELKVGVCAMMEFLYFPEDKTAYIPALITLIIFTAFAFLFFRWIIKVSNKEQKTTEERFPDQTRVDDTNTSHNDS